MALSQKWGGCQPGGVLGLEKGTDCGLNAAELSRANNAKKGGLSSHYNDYGEQSNMFILGFYIKLQLYAFKVVQETLQNK